MKSGALATGVEAQTHPKPAEISHNMEERSGSIACCDSVIPTIERGDSR